MKLLARWRGMRRRTRLLTAAAVVVLALVAGAAAGVATAGPFFWYPCSLDGLQPRGQGHASVLYAADGSRIGLLGASRNRLPVGYDRISPLMRKAIVAAEDRRFWQNDGIDLRGILRALKTDVASGTVSEGGSTLTQQLVRTLYLGHQRTLTRKLTEACLAVELDRRWSKQRILDEYLNDTYFGHRAYGIEAAAESFFGVHARALTLPQAALLAGMPQSPSGYDPFTRPELALRRRAEVLRAMRDDGAIGPADFRHAVHAPLGLHRGLRVGAAAEPYLADFVESELVDLYGAERVRRGGLRVTTSLDPRLQRAAVRAITGTLDRKGDPAGALVSIDPDTGLIRALAVAQVGRRLSFDVAADGRRQAGSTFKAFVLTEAVRRGINPWTTEYLSAPFTGPGGWQVATYEHTYSGRIPLSRATLASDNTVYARLTLDVGPRRVSALAHALGVSADLRPIPSIGARRRPGQPARPHRRLLDAGRRRGPAPACDRDEGRLRGRPHGDAAPRSRAAGPRPEGGGAGDEGARRERPGRHGHGRRASRTPGRRQDRDDRRLRRRLVRGLRAAARDGRLGRLPRARAADA